jgi:hypothetical protein
MRHQRDDLQFGDESERANLSRLSAFVNAPLQKTTAFHPMDYTNEGNTLYLELKTRRIRHNQYPTALIGKNKVDFCSDPSKTYYFCFCYNDGLYFIKYDPEVFKTFRVEEDYTRTPRYGCVNRSQTLVHIPHEFLTPLHDVSHETDADVPALPLAVS